MISIKTFLADQIHILHKLFVYFLVLGFLLPRKYLIIHLIAYLLLKLHNFTNNNYCISSLFEYILRDKENKIKTVDQMVVTIKYEYKLLAFISKKVFNHYLTRSEMHTIGNIIISISVVISIIRYLLQFEFIKKIIDYFKKQYQKIVKKYSKNN